MRFTVDKKELLQNLRNVQPAVARRSSLPVLQGIRLEATCGRLAMDTTDLELLVQLQMQVKTESGHGKAVVPFKLLEKAVKAMPDGDVTVSFEGSEPAGITVANGNKSATIEGLSLNDWPQMGPDVKWQPWLRADAKELADALARIVLCASDDEARPVLTGVKASFDREDGIFELVATDSYRLGVITIEAKPLGEPIDCAPIIPAKALKALATRLKGAEGVMVQLAEAESDRPLLMIGFGASWWTIRTISGEFPNWRQLVPAEGEGGRFEYAEKELASAMKDADSMRSEKATPARIALDDECTVKVIEAGSTLVSYELDEAKYFPNGVGPMEISFNPKFLGDGIKFVASERGVMWVKDASKPALITGDGDSRYVVMPVRLPS